MNGKGDKRRPMQISHEELAARWDAIFNGKPNPNMFDNVESNDEDTKCESKGQKTSTVDENSTD